MGTLVKSPTMQIESAPKAPKLDYSFQSLRLHCLLLS